MRHSLFVLAPLLVAACLPSDPVALPPADASVDTGTDGAPLDAGDSSTTADGGTDATIDASALDFCDRPAAAGAAFCADFEKAVTVGDGWGSATTAKGGTLALDSNTPNGSKKSALAKLSGTSASKATLTKLVNAGGTKNRVTIDFEAYWAFPAWTPTLGTLSIAVVLQNSSNTSSQYFIEIERNPDWQMLLTADGDKPFPALGNNFWHHIRLSYDGSGAKGAISLFVDNLQVLALQQTIGVPPLGAPATFDRILLELGVEDAGSDPTTTSFFIDDVIVRYP